MQFATTVSADGNQCRRGGRSTRIQSPQADQEHVDKLCPELHEFDDRRAFIKAVIQGLVCTLQCLPAIADRCAEVAESGLQDCERIVGPTGVIRGDGICHAI